jgi:hypothetical protein
MLLSGHLLTLLSQIRSFTSRPMHGVCSAQATGEYQGDPSLLTNLPFKQAKTQFPKLGALLPTFGVRLEGLMLKLKNPSLDDH